MAYNSYGNQGGYGGGGYGGQQGGGGYGQTQGGGYGSSTRYDSPSRDPYGQAQGNPYGSSTGGGYGQSQSNPYSQAPSAAYNQTPATTTTYGQTTSTGVHTESPASNRYNTTTAATPASGRYAAGDSMEMGQMNGTSGRPQKVFSEFTSPQDVLQECNDIGREVSAIEAEMTRLKNLQDRSLNSPDPDNQMNSQIDDTGATILARIRTTTDRVRRLKSSRFAGDDQCQSQIRLSDGKIKKTMEQYHEQDKIFRDKLRAQMRRQIMIVRPDASESEINEMVEEGNSQIFSQTLKQSNRRGQAKSTLSNVEKRHQEIKKIEEQMSQLAQLFIDVNELVVMQEAQVTQIETQAQNVEHDVGQANVQLEGAVTKARAARKKKWICLGIVVAILIILAIVIAIIYEVNHSKSS